MVKALQVGKRYNHKSTNIEAECVAIVDTWGVMRETRNTAPFIASFPGDWDIVSPKPRTGKGIGILKSDGTVVSIHSDTATNQIAFREYPTFPIEWKEIV